MPPEGQLRWTWVAPVVVVAALVRTVAAEPEAGVEGGLGHAKHSGLLTETDVPLMRRLVENIDDIEGNSALLLREGTPCSPRPFPGKTERRRRVGPLRAGDWPAAAP